MSAVEVTELGCQAPTMEAALPLTEAAGTGRRPVVAIVGRPNVGKSTFLAQASGRYAETANVPGTTVGVTTREIRSNGREAELVDLPGTFTLDDRSDGLPPFWQLLLEARPDAVLVIADAGDLERHLPLAMACRDLGLPIVLAANLADEAAERGIELDTGRLSQLLAAPVHSTVGRRGIGVQAAVADAVRLAADRASGGRTVARRAMPATPYRGDVVRGVAGLTRKLANPTGAATLEPDLAQAVSIGLCPPRRAATIASAEVLEPERWRVARQWAAQVVQERAVAPRLADRLGRQVTAPWPGLPIFAAMVLASLGATMLIGSILSEALASAWGAWASPVLTSAVHAVIPVPALAAATLWAVDSGLLAMLSVGIPFILAFYVILAVLEDSGYLAATAVLTDRVFNALGLPGRAALPILAATGCNVPAIYGTRVLDSRRERVLASFLIVLTPCSARSAVVIAALAPFAGWGVALAAFGVVALVAVASGVAANALVPGHQSPLVLELPPLRRPIPRQVAAKAWFRFRSFVRIATPVMLIGSFVLGLAFETGAIAPLEAAIGPAVGWLLGLPAVAGIALLLAFLRKELALQLLVVLAIAEYGAGASSLGSFLSPGQLFVYAIVTAVSIPCAATLATLADEFGWRSAATISAGVLGVALVAGAVAARVVGVA